MRAKALLAPVPKRHLDSASDAGMTTVLCGSNAALFWEGGDGVEVGAPVYIYESLDEDRPVGESRVTWLGSFIGYIFRDQLTVRDEVRKRPPSTQGPDAGEGVAGLLGGRRSPPARQKGQFAVSDLSTPDGKRISSALVPHGPTPVAG